METAVQRQHRTLLFIFSPVFLLFCTSPVVSLASKLNKILPAHAMKAYGSGILAARYLYMEVGGQIDTLVAFLRRKNVT